MGKQKCASCGGNGDCRECKGRGHKIGTFGGKSTCLKCGGAAKCKNCKGTGYVDT